MLATKAGPNQYKACRDFKLESSAAEGGTGSEGGEAGGMSDPRFQLLQIQYSLHFLFFVNCS
jgi:hypothetical protein